MGFYLIFFKAKEILDQPLSETSVTALRSITKTKRSSSTLGFHVFSHEHFLVFLDVPSNESHFFIFRFFIFITTFFYYLKNSTWFLKIHIIKVA